MILLLAFLFVSFYKTHDFKIKVQLKKIQTSFIFPSNWHRGPTISWNIGNLKTSDELIIYVPVSYNHSLFGTVTFWILLAQRESVSLPCFFLWPGFPFFIYNEEVDNSSALLVDGRSTGALLEDGSGVLLIGEMGAWSSEIWIVSNNDSSASLNAEFKSVSSHYTGRKTQFIIIITELLLYWILTVLWNSS